MVDYDAGHAHDPEPAPKDGSQSEMQVRLHAVLKRARAASGLPLADQGGPQLPP